MYKSQQERKELRQDIQDEIAPLVKRIEALEKRGAWLTVDTAPADMDVQLGWFDWHSGEWTQKVGYARCPKGGWLDGQATHWQPLPPPLPRPHRGGGE